MTRKQIEKALRQFAILVVDSREQDKSIYESAKNAVTYPLEAGDYTFMVMPNKIFDNTVPLLFTNFFLVERKSGDVWKGGGYAEMKNNIMGNGHKCFKKEFQYQCDHFFLLLENTESPKDLFKCREYGKMKNKSYAAAYETFFNHRNNERKEKRMNPIEVVHCMKIDSYDVIFGLFVDRIFDELKKKNA